jgi:hypothetical protein
MIGSIAGILAARLLWGVLALALALAFIAFWLLLDSDCEHAPEADEDYDRHVDSRKAG